MPRRSLLPFVFVAAGCHVRPESLVPAEISQHADSHSEYLRARPATFVVVGDASSFAWPALLQDLLDVHAGKPALYRVENGAVELGPTRAEGEHAAPFRVLAQAGLAALKTDESEEPRTALCVVSLRGICDERGPVKSENDMVGAEMGADALERLAVALHESGIERVAFATPLFAAGAEPELGLEHVAIERLLSRGHAFVVAGPDLFSASRHYFPDAYAEDKVHPNQFGTKLVAEEWFRWLAGPDAREETVEALYARDYDVEALEAAHAEQRGLPRP